MTITISRTTMIIIFVVVIKLGVLLHFIGMLLEEKSNVKILNIRLEIQNKIDTIQNRIITDLEKQIDSCQNQRKHQ